jgi:hypothetical protein
VICSNDNAIPVFAQEAMATRAGRVERLETPSALAVSSRAPTSWRGSSLG